MDLEQMHRVLGDQPGKLERQAPHAWHMTFPSGVHALVICDPTHDRMRIIAPIASVEQIEVQHLALMMEANFHTALDARYATSEGLVYAAFIHPLGSLTDADLESAVRQVVSLVHTFGGSYSSGELVFGQG